MTEAVSAWESDVGFSYVCFWIEGAVVGEADVACWAFVVLGGFELGLLVEIVDEAFGTWSFV